MTDTYNATTYSTINDMQTAKMDYLSKYTAHALCIKNNPTNSSTACASTLSAFNTAKNNAETQNSNLSTTSLDNLTQDTYNTNNIAINTRYSENLKKQSTHLSAINSTFYLESKRETDAVIYAWTLWLVIFIATAIAVFTYM